MNGQGYGAFGPYAGAVHAGWDRAVGQKRERATQNALAGFATDPDKAIQNFLAVDAPSAIPLYMQREQQKARAAQDATKLQDDRRQSAMKAYGFATDALKRVREADGDIGMAFDQLDQSGYLDTIGLGAEDKARYKAAIVANPNILDALGQQTDDKGVVVSGGGMGFVVDPRTGRELFRTPRPILKLGAEETAFDWGEGGQPSGTPASSGPLTLDTLRPHFVAQESRGNYGAKNAETGALGAYQVMPATGAVLAKRLGLPWRPDMMTKTDPASKRYQDAIGGAAIQEAIDAGGGDLATTAMYYHGGSNRKGWGPRTRKYAEDMAGRVGGGGAGGPRPVAKGAPKPEKPKAERMTPDEVAAEGLPPGVYYRDTNGMPTPIKGPSDAGGGLTKQQQGAARTKMGSLRGMETQLARVERAMAAAEKGGWTGYLGGRVPGALDKESDVFDKSVRLLASQIRALTRTPGEGSMSDYESRLAEMTLPSRSDTPEGRREAIAGLRDLIRNTRAGYEEMLGSAATSGGAAPAASGGGLPRLSPQQAAKLPPGTPFIGVDGKRRIRN